MSDSHTHTQQGQQRTQGVGIGPEYDIDSLEDHADTFETATLEADADERIQLAETLVALADAYGRRGEFDAEASTIDRLEELRSVAEAVDADADVDVDTDTEADAHNHLATALANATAVTERQWVYETGIDPERIETHRARLETLYGSHTEAAVAEALARATAQTAHAYGKAERPDRIRSLLERLETLYVDHPTASVAASLAQGHAHGELYLDDDDGEPTDRLERVQSLTEAHPRGAVVAGLAGVIAGRTNADARREDIETIERRIARIETLADEYPDAKVAIERWLPAAATNATRVSFDLADYERLEGWGHRTDEYHEQLGTPSSATWAAAAVFYSARGSFFEGEVEKGTEKLERLRELEAEYDNPVFEHWLARSLFDSARGHAEQGHYEQAREAADELEAYAVGHDDQAQIEEGLEALRSQAPGLFGDEELVGVGCEEEGCETEADADAEAETASVEPPAANEGIVEHGELQPEAKSVPTPEPESGLEPATGLGEPSLETNPGPVPDSDPDPVLDKHAIQTQTQELSDAIQSLDRPSADSEGCGSGSCGSCSSQPTPEPARIRDIVGAVLIVGVVGLSMLYGAYRLLKLGRGAVGSVRSE